MTAFYVDICEAVRSTTIGRPERALHKKTCSHRLQVLTVREKIRTPDTLVRSHVLYPAELHAHAVLSNNSDIILFLTIIVNSFLKKDSRTYRESFRKKNDLVVFVLRLIRVAILVLRILALRIFVLCVLVRGVFAVFVVAIVGHVALVGGIIACFVFVSGVRTVIFRHFLTSSVINFNYNAIIPKYSGNIHLFLLHFI